MLVVGMRGQGHVGQTGLTDAEYRSHFALWCLLAAPLMIGCDVRSMDDFTHALLSDRGLIAINQDSLGRQGYRVPTPGHGHGQVWVKAMDDGSWAVGFFNTGELGEALLTIGWEHLGLDLTTPAGVHNLLTGRQLSHVTTSYSTRVAPHDVAVVRIVP